MSESFREISPADFFYRNRDLAGFNNPTRSMYSAIRELVENSLDACELYRIPPKIYVRLSYEENYEKRNVYRLKVADNGSGIPPEYIPSAFGQILYGSKYKLRQVRGTFGLGGKMAILYGQITTHSSAYIISSVGNNKIYEFEIRIDIQKNRPEILKKKFRSNRRKWHGTVVEFSLEGDYPKAMPKVLEYLRQTAMVNPYADITFVDPRGRLYMFEGVTKKMPKPPSEIEPHPYGCDVEIFMRMIDDSRSKSLQDFMTTHFHRVGKKTAKRFLKHVGISGRKNPKKLTPNEIVQLVQSMKPESFKYFLPPDANCLSPLSNELLEMGLQKDLNPEFVATEQRNPSAYSGYPFIVEIGIAYGGNTPNSPGITLYRFANKIPLLYDEASDVSRKVINNEINWNYYKVTQGTPVAVVVHICSTKVPYKTVGKEFIADRPEIEREIKNGINNVARRLSRYLSKKISIAYQKQRVNIFQKYLPKIAQFSTKLAGKKKIPNIEPLVRSMMHETKKT
ncbi:MAG: DNA topoisomerase VI subunit B [Candidatus Bathyarchaeota archaeon]|nr:MAG: DNA topoisomerase VI subunit B [Candidatus Bathyarchaeota archaeon]